MDVRSLSKACNHTSFTSTYNKHQGRSEGGKYQEGVTIPPLAFSFNLLRSPLMKKCISLNLIARRFNGDEGCKIVASFLGLSEHFRETRGRVPKRFQGELGKY